MAVSTESNISELKEQISKLTTSVNKLENRGKLPSQPDVNPRQNASAIALRSGKEIPSSDATSLQQDHAEATATEPENFKNSSNVPVWGRIQENYTGQYTVYSNRVNARASAQRLINFQNQTRLNPRFIQTVFLTVSLPSARHG